MDRIWDIIASIIGGGITALITLLLTSCLRSLGAKYRIWSARRALKRGDYIKCPYCGRCDMHITPDKQHCTCSCSCFQYDIDRVLRNIKP